MRMRQRSPRRSWSGLRSRGERGLARCYCLEDQARFLKRQLSLPVSTMSQWWVRRSSSAVVIFGSPKTLGHSPKARLGDDDRRSLVEPADEMEQQLPAGLSKGEIAEFVEDHEVEAREVIGEPSLAAGAALGLELVDEIDGGEEAPARSGADAASGDGDGQMRLARPGSTDEDDVALLGDEAAAGQIAHESLVDRRGFECEVVDVLGQRQLGDRELVLDRACLLLRDL